ncbi:MAG: DUF3108 domain-containing protein, partial [Wenzhouxiangella sp.]|nr:DUF3108 domain-containing protein [Wenzhouxiangella sp.]
VALEAALMGMPLREGLRTPIRYAEVGMQQRVRFFQLEVHTPETVEVPAGTYDAWRLELGALDGEGGDRTIWISTDAPHKTVQVKGKLPPMMGGGDYTTVLKSVDS